MPREKTLRLVLGDQLNLGHSWFSKVRRDTAYVMMEVRQETDYVRHHIQKVAGFFAAMRRFAAALAHQGHRVVYLRLDDPDNAQRIGDNVSRLIQKQGFTRFEYLLPDEYRLDRELAAVASRLPIPTTVYDTEHFITGRGDLQQWFGAKKRYLMESFYRQMRKTHGILMEKGKPLGGRWNFDARNRNRYDGAVPIRTPLLFANDVTSIVEMIDRAGVAIFGEISPGQFTWPIDEAQARLLLADFIDHRLDHFGTYQDAMTTRSWSLFHSRLSFALNTKMLHPMEVVRAALERLDRPGQPGADISQVEGFVRQILGWREFIRGIYWAHMPEYEHLNFFGHKAPLPAFYWTGRTRMACMHAAIGQSLTHAYAHHIQRLMVTGNFALLAGVDPDAVDAWYLGVYIDAVQWVEIVNTRGMSQFADGGIVATKPYVSTANYIRKMSDYCDHCHYDAARRIGDRACPFNSLYWDFLNRHRDKLEANARIGMIYRVWDKRPETERRQTIDQAQELRRNLDRL